MIRGSITEGGRGSHIEGDQGGSLIEGDQWGRGSLREGDQGGGGKL